MARKPKAKAGVNVPAIANEAFVDKSYVGRKGRLILGGLPPKEFERLKKVGLVRSASGEETAEGDLAAAKAAHDVEIQGLHTSYKETAAATAAAHEAAVKVIEAEHSSALKDQADAYKALETERDVLAERLSGFDPDGEIAKLQARIDELEAGAELDPDDKDPDANPDVPGKDADPGLGLE